VLGEFCSHAEGDMEIGVDKGLGDAALWTLGTRVGGCDISASWR
jgi:hypothetical protein